MRRIQYEYYQGVFFSVDDKSNPEKSKESIIYIFGTDDKITHKDISKRRNVGGMELNSKIKGRGVGTVLLDFITDSRQLKQKTYLLFNEYLV